MTTQYTDELGLPYPQTGDPDWDVPIVQATQMVSASLLGALAVRPSDPGATEPLPSTSLNVDVAAGSFQSSTGGLVAFGGASDQALPDDATTFLWLTDGGTLASSTAFPGVGTNIVRLARVVTSGGTITVIDDLRIALTAFGGTPLGSNYVLKAGDTFADGSSFALGTLTGTKWGTAADQKQAWFGATPRAKGGSNEDLKDLLASFGFLVNGSATPLNLDGGALACGAATLSGDLTLGSGCNLVAATSGGTKIGTAAGQLLAFFGATPVSQRSSNADLRQALIDLGFVADGGANSLDLNGGTLTAGALVTAVQSMSVASLAGDGPVGNAGLVKVTTPTGSVFANLPTPATALGRVFTIKKVDGGANSVFVSAGTATIEGNTTYELASQWQYVTVVSDGTNYLIIGAN